MMWRFSSLSQVRDEFQMHPTFFVLVIVSRLLADVVELLVGCAKFLLSVAHKSLDRDSSSEANEGPVVIILIHLCICGLSSSYAELSQCREASASFSCGHSSCVMF